MADGHASFKEIAEALLTLVRHDQALTIIAAPFMADLPPAPGVTDAYERWCRQMALVSQAQQLIADLAPHEAKIRALLAPTI